MSNARPLIDHEISMGCFSGYVVRVPFAVFNLAKVDLTELGRTPIAVVASGAKSILDIGRTLEVLVSSYTTFQKTLLSF